jgi:hypothetical protein
MTYDELSLFHRFVLTEMKYADKFPKELKLKKIRNEETGIVDLVAEG